MKLLEYHDILNGELFTRSMVLKQAWDDVRQSIALAAWIRVVHHIPGKR